MTLKLYPLMAVILLSLDVPAQNLLNPRTQPKFQKALPIPSVIDARGGGTFTIPVTQFNQDLGLKDPATNQPMLTTVWGYGGSYPGPTIVAQKDVAVSVFWLNNLVDNSNQPLPHLLPVDVSIQWALSGIANWQQYGVPIVTHLHGGHTESASDGLPESWYTPSFSLKGPSFIKGDIQPYHYANDQEAATIWYHDHALGITRLNVYAGLAGFYLLTDNIETTLKANNQLPAAPYDIGLAIQDKMFTNTGALFYPSIAGDDDAPAISVLPEFFGDFILVNGAIWPVLEVEPRQYRFRILNGSDSRFYNLFLSSGQTITQIGSDNGFLPAPYPVSHLLIGTGERKDVIIDFTGKEGQSIIMHNNAKTPFPKGSAVDPLTTGRIMAFRVTKPLNTSYPLTSTPSVIRSAIPQLTTTIPPRKLILFEAEDEFERLKPMLGTFENGVMSFHDPITEDPVVNTTEIWEVYNETEDAHTLHLHMVRMQLVNRQKFKADVDEETGKPSNVRLIGQPKLPNADEAGWKDTYIMFPGEVTRVIATFDIEGLSAWHCHVLSHEDHEMMRPYFIQSASSITSKEKIQDATVLVERNYQLRVFPNPFNDHLNVRLLLPLSSMLVINIYDAKGSLLKQVYNGNRNAGEYQYSLDASEWSKGIYFMEVVVDGKRMTRKLVLD